jgi:hypothetical protein
MKPSILLTMFGSTDERPMTLLWQRLAKFKKWGENDFLASGTSAHLLGICNYIKFPEHPRSVVV